jgi:tRNA nucleotidyltransferase (CCA-adding enzyme)
MVADWRMGAMKIYQVGGSLRDELLGLPVVDRDWVVVGATPAQMVAAGYKPVGRDFPVFLHPDTHEEYALARTERKTAPGYKGFVFHAAADVTLEEDLARRDFTVNAMAREAGDPRSPIVDPFDGRGDVARRVLRHVGPAFAEDPVRILRGARFVARFGFTVDPVTLDLMRAMTAAGEVDALVAERVWQELSRGLMERDPPAMFAMLGACNALGRLAAELPAPGPASMSMRALAAAVAAGLGLPERFTAVCVDLDAGAIERLCVRLRVPTDCRDLALLWARHRAALQAAATLDAAGLAELVRAADGLRQPGRFEALVGATGACLGGAGVGAATIAVGARRLAIALDAVRGIDAGAVARQASTPAAIQVALARAREEAVDRALDGAAAGGANG